MVAYVDCLNTMNKHVPCNVYTVRKLPQTFSRDDGKLDYCNALSLNIWEIADDRAWLHTAVHIAN